MHPLLVPLNLMILSCHMQHLQSGSVKEMLLRALNFCSADRLQVTLETQATVLEAFHKIFCHFCLRCNGFAFAIRNRYNLTWYRILFFFVIVRLRHIMTTIQKQENNFLSEMAGTFMALEASMPLRAGLPPSSQP